VSVRPFSILVLRPRYLSLLNTGVVLPRGATIRRERGSVRCQKLTSCVRAVGPSSFLYFIFREWRWWKREANHTPSCLSEGLRLTAFVLLYGVLPRSSCASHIIFVVADSVFQILFFGYACYAKQISVYQQALKIHKKIQDATMYQNFIIPYLYVAQHVSADTPPIIRSLKLHWQTLVFHTWKVGGRCQARLTTSTIHTSSNLPRIKSRGCQSSFRLLILGHVSPETRWATYKYGIIKFLYIVASCWIFLYELYYDARTHKHQDTEHINNIQFVLFKFSFVNAS
jgi:hypothetical protein